VTAIRSPAAVVEPASDLPATGRSIHSVALIIWENEIEHFLELLNTSLVEFCTVFEGRCVFPYAVALREAGLHVRAEAERVRSRYDVEWERLPFIPNLVDLFDCYPGNADGVRERLGVPPDAVLAVWHGRVSLLSKGLDMLIEAWERVRSSSAEPLRLLLVGTSESAPELRSRLAERGSKDVIWIDEFGSDRARLRRYLAASDVYLFPSRREGLALAPLEAMACGLPVVASAAAGVPELVEEGEDAAGIVVPCDDAEAFAAAARRVMDSEEIRTRLSRRMPERALSAFSTSAVGNRLSEALEAGARRVSTHAAHGPLSRFLRFRVRGGRDVVSE
jgi:glycosyltransferase involved in cell wall biosynthesis